MPNTDTIDVTNGLSLIEATLQKQYDDGLVVVDYNKICDGCGDNNLWGYLYMIVPHDKDLAERVRKEFLKKSPQEALALIKKTRREYFDKAMAAGLL